MPMSILCLISTEQEGCTHTGKLLEEFFCPYGLNFIDWQYFVALDFGIRCFIIIASGISFTVTIISVSYITEFKVICVVGSPMLCAAIIPTISPGAIIDFLY
jgi:hypothetical protein